MKRVTNRRLFSYWNELRAGRSALPGATAAHPALRAMLAGAFLIEADGRRAYPIRVVGTALGLAAPNAGLGASFLECWDTPERRDVEALLPAVHDDGRPLVLGALAHGPAGRAVPVEILLLPLSRARGVRPNILGGLAMAEGCARPAPPRGLSLVSARAVTEPARVHGSGGFAEERSGRLWGSAPAFCVIDGGLAQKGQV